MNRRSCFGLWTVIAIVTPLFTPGVVQSAVPTATRIDEIAALLPAQPVPIGAPVSDRTAWTTLAGRLPVATLLTEADRIVATPTPELPDDLYLTYSRTGNRSAYEAPYNQRKDRLSHFAWAEALERRGRYLPALQREIDAVLAEKTWVMPAHDASLVNFNGRAIEVDLGASARGWSLALIAAWFGAEIGTDRHARIVSEVRRRIVDPYAAAVRRGPAGGFWWIQTTNNWNAVCHAGVVGAALATVPDRRTRAEIVAMAEANLPPFMAGFADDGLCSEGIGYWSYGFGHYVLLGETLNAATGGRYVLLAGEKTRRITEFAGRMELVPGLYPAFADNSVNVTPATWVAPLARRLLAGGAEPYASAALGWTNLARDHTFIGAIRAWTPSTGAAAPSGATELRSWFADSQVLVTRVAPDFSAAIKGGHNDELHNHNDLGSFVVALGRSLPLVDPGSEVYTARTFSSRRYDSKVLNSFGHAVPVVAGQLQPAGRQYAARVVSTSFALEADRLVLDLRRAYAVAALQRLERTFTAHRGARAEIAVRDEFEFTSPQTFGTALITFASWRQRDATTLEIGTGADLVTVSLAAEGGALAIRSEVIDEALSSGLKPTRIGIDFAAPLIRGSISVTIRRANDPLRGANTTPDGPAAPLGNLSSRAEARADADAVIAGVALSGAGRKPILFRGVGPALSAFGVTGVLRDPQLVVFSGNAEIARNNDWSAAPNAAGAVDAAVRAGAFSLVPDSRDAALLLELGPGTYTAQLTGVDGNGVGLVEVYDTAGAGPRLANLSTRGRVSTGDNVLILGLVVRPGAPRWFLIRGVGPGLSSFGVPGVLADPVLTVYRGEAVVAQNDDWGSSYFRDEIMAAATQVSAFGLATNGRDAALLLQLPAGAYTVHISGKGSATGVALGEVYELP